MQNAQTVLHYADAAAYTCANMQGAHSVYLDKRLGRYLPENTGHRFVCNHKDSTEILLAVYANPTIL